MREHGESILVIVVRRDEIIRKAKDVEELEARFSRDYERLCTTSEALIYAATGHLMLRRLARN